MISSFPFRACFLNNAIFAPGLYLFLVVARTEVFLQSSGVESSIIRMIPSFKWMRLVRTPLILRSFAKELL